MSTDWKATAARVQAERESKIPAEWRIPQAELDAAGDHGGLKLIESKLNARELEITGWTASEAAKVGLLRCPHRSTCLPEECR